MATQYKGEKGRADYLLFRRPDPMPLVEAKKRTPMSRGKNAQA